MNPRVSERATLRATVNGRGVAALEPERKRTAPSGFHIAEPSHTAPRMTIQVSHCRSSGPGLASRARETPDVLSRSSLTPLTTFYLKFNLKWEAFLTNFQNSRHHDRIPPDNSDGPLRVTASRTLAALSSGSILTDRLAGKSRADARRNAAEGGDMRRRFFFL